MRIYLDAKYNHAFNIEFVKNLLNHSPIISILIEVYPLIFKKALNITVTKLAIRIE